LTTATCASLKFVYFENEFGFRCTFSFRIVNFIYSILIIKYLLHLFFGNKSAMVPKPVFCEIFPTVIPHVIFIHPLLLFFPVFKNFNSTVILWKLRSCTFTGVRPIWANSTMRIIAAVKWRHSPIPLTFKRCINFIYHILIKRFLWFIIRLRPVNWNITQNGRFICFITVGQ